MITLCYILPLWLIISVSFEGSPDQYFRLIPKEFTLKAYEAAFAAPRDIMNAYKVTIISSVCATALFLVLNFMMAFVLSRKGFKLRNILTFLLFFTTLFGGGLVPTYLVLSKLGFKDNILVYIIPGAISGWHIIIFRTAIAGIPSEIIESAKMDGAGEFRLCWQIVLPLSTAILAAQGFLSFIGSWNDWFTTEVYVREPRLRTLQYLLRQILHRMEELKTMILNGEGDHAMMEQLKNMEAVRFAMAVICAGPAMFIFPLFQKYFSKGMIVGSVKG